MFGSSARFDPDRSKYYPGPGSYTPDLKYDQLLPTRRPASAQAPKPGVGVGRYNYLTANLTGEVMFHQKQELKARIGPGSYLGPTVNAIGKKSYNINALDSERRRNRMLTPAASAATAVSRAPVRPEAASLMHRAQQLLAQIKGS
jgi:hypothetical protein